MGVKKLFGLSAAFFSHICGGGVRERALNYPNWSSKFERSRSMCVRWVVGESAGRGVSLRGRGGCAFRARCCECGAAWKWRGPSAAPRFCLGALRGGAETEAGVRGRKTEKERERETARGQTRWP